MRKFLFLAALTLTAQRIPVGPSNPTGQHGVSFTVAPSTDVPATATTPEQLASTGFNVYRSQKSGGPYTLVGSGVFVGGQSATYIDGCDFPAPANCSSTFTDGSTWFWVFTWTNPNATIITNTRTNNPQESVDSPELSGTFPTPTSISKGTVTVKTIY